MLEESEIEEGQQAHIAMDQQPDLAFAIAARSAWTQLLKKIYEVEPLICPHCGGEMRFLAVLEEEPVIEKILRHIKQPPLCAPPNNDWPENGQIPLTYHPVPDIA